MDSKFKELFEDRFYDSEYKLSWHPDSVVFEPVDDTQLMPTISCVFAEDSGVTYVKPRMKFPDLKFEDMEFYDSFGYWLKKWYQLSGIMDALMQFTYTAEDYDDDDIATL